MTSGNRRTRELSAHLHSLREQLHRIDKGTSQTINSLSVKEAFVLLNLGNHGPMTMSALARALQLTTSSATTVIDKLERRRFVTRIRGDSDRRVVRVTLARAGLACFKRLENGHLKLMRNILLALDDGEQQQLLTLFRKISSRLKQPERRND